MIFADKINPSSILPKNSIFSLVNSRKTTFAILFDEMIECFFYWLCASNNIDKLNKIDKKVPVELSIEVFLNNSAEDIRNLCM